MSHSINKKPVLYIILVLTLTWAFAFLIKFFHLSQQPLTAMMSFPMLLALLFMLASKDRFSMVGWKLPPIKYVWIGIFLPILQIGVIVTIEWSLGLVAFNSHHYLAAKPTPILLA